MSYDASYQQTKGQLREALTMAVEMLTAAVLDMKEPGANQGLKNAEPLLSAHLKSGLDMALPSDELTADAARRGIDVSYWNGRLTKGDFAKIKKQGLNFVIARAGGYVGTMEDSTFGNNYLQAKDAGLRFGVSYLVRCGGLRYHGKAEQESADRNYRGLLSYYQRGRAESRRLRLLLLDHLQDRKSGGD